MVGFGFVLFLAFWVVLVILSAVATAVVADHKGQNGAVWFLIGLVAPVLGLLVAVVAIAPAGLGPVRLTGRGVAPLTAGEAARENPVARFLAANPGISLHGLAEHTHTTERDVHQQLVALRSLGFADADADGRWRLTAAGAAALTGDGTAALPH